MQIMQHFFLITASYKMEREPIFSKADLRRQKYTDGVSATEIICDLL